MAKILVEEKYHNFKSQNITRSVHVSARNGCLQSMKARQLNPSNPSFVCVDKADHARNIRNIKGEKNNLRKFRKREKSQKSTLYYDKTFCQHLKSSFFQKETPCLRICTKG